MKILVSACLLGENCKYNGGNNRNEELIAFLKGKEVIAVCPETAGGLPSPRDSVELIDNIPYDRCGNEYSEAFEKGIAATLALCENEEIAYAVLQSRSPTCGTGSIYDGSFSKTLTEGNGRLTQALLERGITVFDVADFIRNKRYEE